jgi:hypothetical protein
MLPSRLEFFDLWPILGAQEKVGSLRGLQRGFMQTRYP